MYIGREWNVEHDQRVKVNNAELRYAVVGEGAVERTPQSFEPRNPQVALDPEQVVATAGEAGRVAEEIGFPVVAKLNGDTIAHKTERGLVRLGLGDDAVEALHAASADLAGTPAPPAAAIVESLAPPPFRGVPALLPQPRRFAV